MKTEQLVEDLEESTKQEKIWRWNSIKARYALNKDYRYHNSKKIRLLDIIVVLILIVNLGALCMTHFLVGKQPDNTFVEVNPVACTTEGFDCHTQAKELFTSIMKRLLLYSLWLMFYLAYRNYYLTNHRNYAFMLSTLGGYYLYLFGYDFINDLGFLLGVLTG